MGYDVLIGSNNFNYTYNVSKLFYDHFPEIEGCRGGLYRLDGLKGCEAVPVLANALYEIDKTRLKLWKDGAKGETDFCNKYDPENGWGSTVGAILFLSLIMGECAMNPDEVITVSWRWLGDAQ